MRIPKEIRQGLKYVYMNLTGASFTRDKIWKQSKCPPTNAYIKSGESHSVMSDSSQPHGIVHGILQARILEWVAMLSSRVYSQPRDWTLVSHIAGRFFTIWPPGMPKNSGMGSLSILQQIFPNQESNWGLLHCRWILYQLGYQGSPILFLPTSKNCLFSSSVLDLVTLVDWMVKWYEQKLGR